MRLRSAAVAVGAFTLGITVGAASLAFAQDNRFRVFPPPPPTTEKPAAAAGESEIGLRIKGRHQGRVVGTLVAKVDGKWVEVQLAPQDMLIQSR
jgi:hypothetical protein